jgi:hypothetical protein
MAGCRLETAIALTMGIAILLRRTPHRFPDFHVTHVVPPSTLLVDYLRVTNRDLDRYSAYLLNEAQFAHSFIRLAVFLS